MDWKAPSDCEIHIIFCLWSEIIKIEIVCCFWQLVETFPALQQPKLIGGDLDSQFSFSSNGLFLKCSIINFPSPQITVLEFSLLNFPSPQMFKCSIINSHFVHCRIFKQASWFVKDMMGNQAWNILLLLLFLDFHKGKPLF